MHFYFDCIPCLTRQAVDSVKMVTQDYILQEKIIRLVLREMEQLDFSNNPPYMSRLIHKIIKEKTGHPDPYKEIKNHFNQDALNLYEYLEETVQNSPFPFEQAIRFAASANIIDFGLSSNITMKQVKKTLQDSLDKQIKGNTAHELAQEIKHAKKILYLGDNCGEIVMDKLLLTRMPREKVTFVVKGQPIINDAIMEDAEFAGITDLVRVIDNGSDVPGTILKLCSNSFLREFAEADLIIAKGQGNYECLNEIKNKKIFFIFKVKCPVVADLTNCSVGDIVLKKHS
ncbi:MAG: damage-control phosphatase ARMT1 family protein [Peptococcia bacterium]|jgi:uncharacterized protein with ATP-grasp and redox domains